MIRLPWFGQDTALYLTPRWLQAADSPFLFAAILLLPLLLILFLYRYELRLVRWPTALLLLAIRVLVIASLVLVVALEPVVAQHHTEVLPSRLLVALDLSDSMDVHDPAGTTGTSLKSQALDLLLNKGLLDKLKAKHQVDVVAFGDKLWPLAADQLKELPRREDNKSVEAIQASDLNLPLRRAADSRDALLGVILFSDGQHNKGPTPIDQARELGKRGMPVYPIALGSRQPLPDLAVFDFQGPKNVLKDAEATVRVRVRAQGLPAQDLVVELSQAGTAEKQTEILKHDGNNHLYTATFPIRLDKVGVHGLEVKVRTTRDTPAEATTDNNKVTSVVRVLRDKARVLLVDDEARWEFYYLASAFLRDPALDVTRVLFSQPRIDVIPEDELKKSRHPLRTLPPWKKDDKFAGEDPLFQYDAIFLGDVDPEHLPRADRARLERYVADRGGTLILQAGKRYFPQEYVAKKADDDDADPLLKLLPIVDLRPLRVDEGLAMHFTSEGNTTPFLQLDADPAQNSELWSKLPKHYWALVGKPRPAAQVLARPRVDQTLSPLEKTQGLIVQQPYGFGKVLYVGLDSTWRWRYRVGDHWHHRFWGQLARWAAADQLLPAGNRYVRFGTREPLYPQGKDVDIVVRLSEDVPPLPGSAKPAVRIIRRTDKGKELTHARVPLQTSDKRTSLLVGTIQNLPRSDYRIELDIPEIQDKIDAPPQGFKEAIAKGESKKPQATFTVLPPQTPEMLELGMNFPLLNQIAVDSGGEVIEPANIDELIDRFTSRIEVREHRDETRIWHDTPAVWWTLGLLLSLLTIEWTCRKMAGLP